MGKYIVAFILNTGEKIDFVQYDKVCYRFFEPKKNSRERILEIVRNNTVIQKRALTRMTQWLHHEERTNIIHELLEAGKITSLKKGKLLFYGIAV